MKRVCQCFSKRCNGDVWCYLCVRTHQESIVCWYNGRKMIHYNVWWHKMFNLQGFKTHCWLMDTWHNKWVMYVHCDKPYFHFFVVEYPKIITLWTFIVYATHLNFVQQHLALNILLTPCIKEVCQSFMQGKKCWEKVMKSSERWSMQVWELVHNDV
jgi:hypothetical protein